MILSVAMLFATMTMSAQFYVALSGGPTYKASEKELSQTGGLKGTFGEGKQFQIRGGYYFTEKLGVDLGIGYLYGDPQQIIKSPGLNIEGSGRAFGVALTGFYDITKNVYVRGGLLTKVYGQTELKGNLSQQLPANMFNPAAPAGMMVPLEATFERDNKGQFPLGFIGAFGCKFEVKKNLEIFVEMEYMGINVPADKSTLKNLDLKIAGKSYTNKQIMAILEGLPLPDAVKAAKFGQIYPLIADEITFTDNPTDYKTQLKSTDAPYSSFGFNFGVRYRFGK